MTVINTNTASITAQANMKKVSGELEQAMERLSSGLRINGAADDAAGLAIVNRMESQVRGLNMAIRNANDGISLTQSAEGGMEEVTNILQRMRELSVQASNGTYSNDDRAQLQAEVDQLSDELDRIAETTTFNGQNILDGSYSGNMSITANGQGGIGVEIGSVNSALLGGRADGPAEAAALATISFGGVTTNASDYHGASFDVAVDGVTTNVNLPTSNGINPTGAVASTDFAGDDFGPAKSILMGDNVFTGRGNNGGTSSGTISLSDKEVRIFSMRVNDTDYIDLDITDALSSILGVDVTQMDAPETYAASTSDEVTQTQFLKALNDTFAARSEFTGDNAVTASINNYGMLQISAGGDNFVSLRESTDGSTQGAFVSTFVYDAHGTVTNELTQPMNAIDLSSNANAAMKVSVNGGADITVEFYDKLNDSAFVKDRSAVSVPELTRVLQAALDENFTGDNAITVGYDHAIRDFTFDVAGGLEKVKFTDGATITDGSSASSTGVAYLLGTSATEVNNIGTTTNLTSVLTDNINSLTNDDESEHFVFNAQVNDSKQVSISMVSHFKDNVADMTAATAAEVTAALQDAFDAHFTGDDAVTVTLGANGSFRFDVAGGTGYLALSEYTDTSGTGTFVTTIIDSNASLTKNPLTVAESASGTLAAHIGQGDVTLFGANVNAVGGGGNGRFNPVFETSASHFGAVGNTDRIRVFYDVDNVEPIMLDTAGVRAIATIDPDATGGQITSTMSVTGFNDNASGRVISVDYVVGGVEKTITLTTAVGTALASSDSTTIGTSDVTSVTTMATSIVNALIDHADFAATAADGASAIGVASSGGTITFTVGDATTADDLAIGDGIAGVRLDTEATQGIVVTSSDDTFDLTVGEQAVTNLAITTGTYNSVEAYAAEIQRAIDASGKFENELAVDVVVKEGTTVADPTRTVKYVAFENAAGKYMQYGAATGELKAFASEADTTIDATNILAGLAAEVGLSADTTTFESHGKTGGGIDTTQDGGTVSVTIQDGSTSVTRAVSVAQNANQSFASFASDLETAINSDFAGDGYSVAVTAADGAFSLTLDQAGAKTVTLSGSIVEDAFGASLSATGSDGEGDAFDSMDDVVAAINVDLAAAGGNAVASFDTDTNSFTFNALTGTAGSGSSITLSGGDLDVLQFGDTRSATGSAGNATADTIENINISTASGATSALASIDNALDYINSQRAKLGAIENRLNHTISNLTSVVVNTEASQSRIQDADFAVETSKLTKAQVLSQAATSMLAQANASKQSVLSLLQG